jgi:hypothetical protein
MTSSLQNHELFKTSDLGNHKNKAADLVNSRVRSYKGGRILPSAIRFRYWRTTEGNSIAKIAARLEDRVREFGIDTPYLMTRLYELEQGRFKAPTWLILLLSETYGIKFPWWEFWDGNKP